MPYYQFILPAGSASASRKAEIAHAVTVAHRTVTGAPSDFVNCSFVEVASGSVYVSGEPVEHGRMVGLIRRGRAESLKRRLVLALGDAWAEAGGEPLDRIAIFLHEVPGYHCLENGELLREAEMDPDAILV